MNARAVPERFDVAFSLVGEHRQVVAPIAERVEAVLGRSSVFYDRWYEHWIAGADADLLLWKIYREMADLVVVCVSAEYNWKSWPMTEYRAARDRLHHALALRGRRCILPIRVGGGDVEGLFLDVDIVPDVRAWEVDRAADLVINRLNEVRVSTHLPIWPDGSPNLKWPMADHGAARVAFEDLLGRNNRDRALFICGPSEAGKTHMSQQMARHLRALPEVRSARFDLKGTTGMDLEVQAFAGALNVATPTSGSLSERLGQIVDQLRWKELPTVLIFDSFEAGGEVCGWLEKVLPTRVNALHWLRVIIIGQSVPKRASSIWEEISAQELTLGFPTIEHWFEYGRANRGDEVNIDLVRDVYRLVNGNPVYLAPVFGPPR